MKRYLCILVLAALAGLVAWIAPAFIPARAQGSGPNRCKSNLKNIGTALEMYSTDFSGHYPAELGALVPRYLDELPACPRAGRFTYSYTVAILPDAYTMTCTGGHPFKPR